jgi:hypothetical protein
MNAPLSRLANAFSGSTPSPATSTRVRIVSISVSPGILGHLGQAAADPQPLDVVDRVGANAMGPKNATSPRSTSIGAWVISFQRSPFQYCHSSMRARSRPPRSGQPR